MEAEIEGLLEEIRKAEVAGDASFYDGLAVEQFRVVGPLGFTLDRQQWRGRFKGGKYQCSSYGLSETIIGIHGDVATSVSRADIEATFEGNPSPATHTRVSHVFVRDGGRWKLMLVQHSAIAAPRGDN